MPAPFVDLRDEPPLDTMRDSVGLLRRTLPAVLPRLRRFARALARNGADADDLAQLAIERALARAAQWRPPPHGASDERVESAARGWVFGIMKNAWIDDRRAARRRRELFAEGMAVEQVADHAHRAAEDRLSIDAALQQLPGEQQLAVALVLVEGLSYQEAADVIGIPVGTLTSRLSRGREALATLLDLTGERT